METQGASCFNQSRLVVRPDTESVQAQERQIPISHLLTTILHPALAQRFPLQGPARDLRPT